MNVNAEMVELFIDSRLRITLSFDNMLKRGENITKRAIPYEERYDIQRLLTKGQTTLNKTV